VNTVLIIVTLVEVLLLVVVLAGYLIAIAAKLQSISKTLGLVTFGVRAIESQTAQIGPAVGDVNRALEQVAGALQEIVGERNMTPTREEGPRPTTP
jgi:electron transfer flavoprotein alpha/beta subunit